MHTSTLFTLHTHIHTHPHTHTHTHKQTDTNTFDAWNKNVVQYTTEKYITITLLSFVYISFQISEEIPKCQKNDIHNYYQIKFVSR